MGARPRWAERCEDAMPEETAHPPAAFYDDLAASYDRIYPDWEASCSTVHGGCSGSGGRKRVCRCHSSGARPARVSRSAGRLSSARASTISW